MKTLSKAVAIASLMSAGVMTSAVANAEVSFNAALVSDYVFRGFSYSDNGAALQGSADYSHDSGAYVGTWLTTYDLADEDSGTSDTDIEYDLYAGYWMEAGEFEIDMGITTYNYVDDKDSNTAEVYASVATAGATLSVFRDVDVANTTYLNLGYSAELPSEVALDVAAGYMLDGKVDGEDYWGEDFVDVSASVSKSFAVVDLALTVTNVDYAENEDDETLFFLTASKDF